MIRWWDEDAMEWKRQSKSFWRFETRDKQELFSGGGKGKQRGIFSLKCSVLHYSANLDVGMHNVKFPCDFAEFIFQKSNISQLHKFIVYEQICYTETFPSKFPGAKHRSQLFVRLRYLSCFCHFISILLLFFGENLTETFSRFPQLSSTSADIFLVAVRWDEHEKFNTISPPRLSLNCSREWLAGFIWLHAHESHRIRAASIFPSSLLASTQRSIININWTSGVLLTTSYFHQIYLIHNWLGRMTIHIARISQI